MNWTMFVIWLTLILIAVGGVVVWFVKMIVFKHRVCMTDLGKQGIEMDFKARDYIKDGVRYWQLDKERNKELRNIPIPPAKAINIAKRGKKKAHCIRTETGEIIFLEKNINFAELPDLKNPPDEIKNITDPLERSMEFEKWKDMQLEEFKKEHKGMVLDDTYQPLTTKQRMVMMHNFEKAHTRKGWNWKENLPQIVSIGAAVVLVVSLMIFYGDIAKPVLDARDKEIVSQTIQKESLEIIKDIRQGQQKIISEQEKQGQRIDALERQAPH